MKKSFLLFFLTIFFLNIDAFGQKWENIFHFNNNGIFRCHKVISDESGNFYVAGVFSESYSIYPSRGEQDIFLAKLNSNHEIVWFNQLGGKYIDFGLDIAYKNNTIYLIGGFQNRLYISDDDSLDLDNNSRNIAFLKFSSDGSLLLKKKFAFGDTTIVPQSIEIDKDDSLLICGFYTNELNIDGYHFARNGVHNFISKSDKNGNVSWVKNITGNNTASRIVDITAYDDGYYFTGYFRDSLYLDVKNLKSSYSNKSDLLVYKTDFNGRGSWVRQAYGNGNDVAGSLTGDNYGNVYFTGYFSSPTLTVDSTGAILSNKQLVTKGSQDIFIFKYNKNGVLQWAKNYGSAYLDYAVDIKHKHEFLYITGYYTNQILFGNDLLVGNGASDRNIFIGTFDLNGNMIKGDHVKGSDQGEDISNSLFIDNYNNVFIAGYFKSATLFVGSDQLVNINTTNYNGVIAKYTPPYSVVYTSKLNPTCNSVANGSLLVTPYFGVPPYVYTWSHAPHTGINDSIATGLIAGTYTVQVRDSRDSVATATITLVEPLQLNTSDTIIPVSCFNGNNGAINLTVSGGTPDFIYSWSSPDGSGLNPTAEDQSGLNKGTYYVTIKDKNLCEGKDTFIVTQPAKIKFPNSTITNITIPPGSNGKIFPGVTGGTPAYLYKWNGPGIVNDPSDTLKNLSLGGNYTLQVTDSKSCLADTSFLVASDTMLIAFISSKTDVVCKGTPTGFANVSVSNGSGNYTYAWRDISNNPWGSSYQLQNALANTYYVLVTDITLGKTSEVQVIINEPLTGLSSSISTIDLKCVGDGTGTVNLQVSGGTLPYTYLWDNNSTAEDLNNVQAGTYIVEITDSFLCKKFDTAKVNQPQYPLSLGVSLDKNLLCFGNTNAIASANPSGGTGTYEYLWNDPGNQVTKTATGLRAGTYNVTVTDDNNCTISDQVQVLQPAQMTLTAAIQNPLCTNQTSGQIVATATSDYGPIDYVWTSGKIGRIYTDLAEGMYSLTCTDANGCNLSDSFLITDPLPVTFQDIQLNNVSCPEVNDGNITISATGGNGIFQYSLNGNYQASGSFNSLTAGSYSVDIRDGNGCQSTDSTVSITKPEGIDFTWQNKNVSCYNGNDAAITITVTNTGTFTYSLNNGLDYFDNNGLFSNVPAGEYHLKINDGTCEYTGDTVTVTQPTAITVSGVNKSDVSCSGLTNGEIRITAAGGSGTLSYSVNNGENYSENNGIFTALAANTYTVYVKDTNECSVTGGNLTINEPSEISISAEAENMTCAGFADGEISVSAIGGTGKLSYSINGGQEYFENSLFTGLGIGHYSIKVKDENNCEITGFSFELDEPDAVLVDTAEIVHLTGENNAEIIAENFGGVLPLTYILKHESDSIVSTDEHIANLSSGNYSLYVIDDNNCLSNKLTFTILDNGLKDIIIYDAFSPNNDAVNDLWNIGNISRFRNCKVKIFNTWGNLVFSSDGYAEPWDGKFNGSELPAGTYYYVIDLGDGSKELSGPVNIVK